MSGWPTDEGQKWRFWLLLTQKSGCFAHGVLPKGHKGGLISRKWVWMRSSQKSGLRTGCKVCL